MPTRRLLPVVLRLTLLTLLTLPLVVLWIPARGATGIPTSVGLVYPKEKIFRPGDWAYYKVRGENHLGGASVDYQRVQIGKVLTFRAEDCFWLETGWGPAPDSLVWSAALISEGLFEDERADVWPNYYIRMLHMETDRRGIPRASEVRTVNPKGLMRDTQAERPVYVDAGTDTVQTPRGPIVCQVLEVTRTVRNARDMADSTMQQTTETQARRWMNTKLVPITGLVREEETKTYSERVWPLGKPSTEFPFRIVGRDVYKIDLLDYGHGAKPMISDRIRSTIDRRAGPSAE